MRRVAEVLAVVCVLLFLVVVGGMARRASLGGQTVPLYSSLRYDPHGVAAFRHLLTDLGIETQTLERPRLRDGQRGTLIQVLEVPRVDWSSPDSDVYSLPTDQLLKWVGEGNTLVQLTRTETEEMAELGIGINMGDGYDQQLIHELEDLSRVGIPPEELPHRLRRFHWRAEDDTVVGTLMLREPAEIEPPQSEDWRGLASSGDRVVAGVMKHGEGRVVVVSAPTPVLNAHITDGDNLEFLLGLVGEGPVLFDEWAHGIGHAGTIIEVIFRLGLVPVLLQLGLCLLAYRWYTAGLQTPEFTGPRGEFAQHETIGMLATLYGRSLKKDDLVRAVYDEVVLRLSSSLRVDSKRLRSRLEHLGRPVAQRSLELLDELAAGAARARPHCLQCGYELTGVRSSRCPECGQLLSWETHELAQRAELREHAGADSGMNHPRALAQALTRAHLLSEELRHVRRNRS